MIVFFDTDYNALTVGETAGSGEVKSADKNIFYLIEVYFAKKCFSLRRFS